MKTLFTLLSISVCSIAFGQVAKSPYKQIADQNKKQIDPLNKEILFSKGEAFTEKEWQDYYKQMAPYVKQFFKRDSAHQKFISNTVNPHLVAGDTIESYNVKPEIGIFLKLKPLKK